MKKPPAPVTLSSEAGEALIARVYQSTLSPADADVVERVIRLHFWLVVALEESRLSTKRLRNLLFGKQEKGSLPLEEASTSSPPGDSGVSPSVDIGADTDRVGMTPAPSDQSQPSKPKGGHRPGTGRLGAAAYAGAKRVECRHEELTAGQRCPACGQGSLYDLPPGREIRIDGHALLSALRYELQKLRCSACGQMFTASLPPEAGVEKYSPRARAALAVGRYYLGLPLYRLEGYQAMVGVPVPDATQWDQIEKVADCSYRVFEVLESLAAQGELIYQDDTSVRILSLMTENRQIQARAHAQGLSRAPERTGMFTTSLVVKVGERTIYLYYSGRSHAGENLSALLRKRRADQSPPLVMSDALSRNEVDESTVIRCHCLAHGRRQFSDLEEVFPQECQVVINVLKQVFDHDEQARDEGMSPETRLAYHQDLSQPLMTALKVWLDRQFSDRLVEPNSSLGKAITYLQAHWKTLTRFLQVPGAPLDNNRVERALKLFIRQRKNSLFYRTEHSAYIASMLTSLIATCRHAGVNALDYLVALQENRRKVAAAPEDWLPWTYASRRASP